MANPLHKDNSAAQFRAAPFINLERWFERADSFGTRAERSL